MTAFIKCSIVHGTALLLAVLFSQSIAAQTTLDVSMTADNEFDLYISTSDASAGSPIGSGTAWETTYPFTGVALTPGMTNYIHIVGRNVPGSGINPAAFIGEFTLSDSNYEFADGSGTLYSDITNWGVSTTGWSGYVAPVSQGANGVAPWGTRPDIAGAAEWIWATVGEGIPTPVYFTAQIIPVTVDIGIVVSESIAEVVAGFGPGNLVYTVTVTNNGPADATGLVVDLSTVTPGGINVASIDTVDGSESGGVWTIGNLTALDSATLTITMTVRLTANEGAGTVSATAELSSVNETETNDTNNSDTEATDIRWPEATFDVSKIYENGSGPAVDVTLTCSDTSGLLVYAPQQGTTFTSLTVRRFDTYQNSTTCTVTETVPKGFYESGRSVDCDVTAVDGAANAAGDGVYDCTITNASTLATFSVAKIFIPRNPMEVEVFISCNDGLPLNSSQVITEGLLGVTFIVEKFTAGNLDCEITEVPLPTGYDQFYFANIIEGEAGQIDNTDGCQFQDIVSGNFGCAVLNAAQDATFEVNKVWDILSEGGDLISQDFNLTISCNQAIMAASPGSNFRPGPGPGPGPIYNTSSGKPGITIIKPPKGVRKVTWMGLEGDTSVWVDVSSLGGPAQCTVKERVFSDAVEIDNPCRNPQALSMGQTTSCTITNTVFYEGIPALNRYGLALLALLMLGVGAVGFRRFS